MTLRHVLFSTPALALASLLLSTTPVQAGVVLDPNETETDVAADDSASKCEAPSCEVAFDLPTSTLFLTLDAGGAEDLGASATLLASFAISAESDDASDQTPLLGSSVSLVVDATGTLVVEGVASSASYRLDVVVNDVTDGVIPIASEKVAEGVGIGAKTEVDVSEIVALNLNLTRGHKYQLALALSVTAMGGEAGSASADFGVSSASWDELTIVAGADLLGAIGDLEDRLSDLEDEVDDLEDEFGSHTHEYLTGKGNGHNNTTATTTAPDDDASIDPHEDDGDDSGADNGNGNGNGNGGNPFDRWKDRFNR